MLVYQRVPLSAFRIVFFVFLSHRFGYFLGLVCRARRRWSKFFVWWTVELWICLDVYVLCMETRWCFQIFFIFTPTWWNDPIGQACFFKWVVQPPTRKLYGNSRSIYIYISSITLSSELPQPKYFVMPSVWKGTIIHICLPQHGIPKKETVTIPPPCNWIRLMIETRQNKVCQEFVIVFWVFRMFATMVIIIHPPHVGEMGMSWYNTWQMVGSCLWVSWMTRSFQRFVNKQYIHKSSNLLWPSKNSKTLLQMFF